LGNKETNQQCSKACLHVTLQCSLNSQIAKIRCETGAASSALMASLNNQQGGLLVILQHVHLYSEPLQWSETTDSHLEKIGINIAGNSSS
jgi:hypothetical protein